MSSPSPNPKRWPTSLFIQSSRRQSVRVLQIIFTVLWIVGLIAAYFLFRLTTALFLLAAYVVSGILIGIGLLMGGAGAAFLMLLTFLGGIAFFFWRFGWRVAVAW